MSNKNIGLNFKTILDQQPALREKLEANTKKAFESGSLRSVTKALAYALLVAGAPQGGSTIPLFDNNQAKKVGISDFEQGMKVNSDMIIAGIKVEYAYTTTASGVVTVPDRPYSNLIFSRTSLVNGGVDMDANAAGVQANGVPERILPPAVANSQFVFKVGGVERFRVPVSAFFTENDRKDYLTGDFSDYLSLQEQLMMIQSGQSVTAELHVAEGINLPSQNHFFKWTIIGSALVNA